MTINGIRRHPHSILGHILNFPVGKGLIIPKVFEMLDQTLETLQNSDVALELHHNYLAHSKLSNKDDFLPVWKNISATSIEFYKALAHRIKSYSLKFSLGSDSHGIKNIVPKEQWVDFLARENISEKKLVTPEFFGLAP
jgi:histidinol phosphatase-like PHP family hydrolase